MRHKRDPESDFDRVHCACGKSSRFLHNEAVERVEAIGMKEEKEGMRWKAESQDYGRLDDIWRCRKRCGHKLVVLLVLGYMVLMDLFGRFSAELDTFDHRKGIKQVKGRGKEVLEDSFDFFKISYPRPLHLQDRFPIDIDGSTRSLDTFCSSDPPLFSSPFFLSFSVLRLVKWLFSFGDIHVFALADCTNVICHNGGTCEDVIAGAGTAGMETCVCTGGFHGPDCTLPIDICGTSPDGTICYNAGVCQNSPTTPFYTCTCTNFITGENCGILDNPCESGDYCQNGGVCSFVGNEATCICKNGYTNDTPQRGLIWGPGWSFVNNGRCTVRTSAGIGSSGKSYLSSGEVISWWVIFAVTISLLMYCCYSVCAQQCKKLRWWKAAAKVAS